MTLLLRFGRRSAVDDPGVRGDELAVLLVAQANGFRRNATAAWSAASIFGRNSLRKGRREAAPFIAGSRSGQRGDPRDTPLPPSLRPCETSPLARGDEIGGAMGVG
jgi:hypothetical protein